MIQYYPFKTSLIRGFKQAGYADIGELHLNVFCPRDAKDCYNHNDDLLNINDAFSTSLFCKGF